MAERSAIEWCDATFNPWIGCTKVSPGCDNCYAAQQDSFRKWTPAGWGAGQPRKRTKTWGDPVKWNASRFFQCVKCGWRGEVPQDKALAAAGKLGFYSHECGGDLVEVRRRVFCASLADVFDNEVDPQWRHELFQLIAGTPDLDWLLLTKRIGNAKDMIAQAIGPGWIPDNVWLGATIVNQEEADRDIPKLLATPARVRFLSMEPLLGPVDLRHISHERQERSDDTWTLNMNALTGFKATSPYSGITGPKVDWVIVGGESGPNARPMHPDWARSLRDQCAAAGVPLLFKQWGEWAPGRPGDRTDAGLWMHQSGDTFRPVEGEAFYPAPLSQHIVRIGKKAAGRLLDGVAHDGFPGARQ